MREFIEYLAINDPVSLIPENPVRLAKKYKMQESDITQRTAADRIGNHEELLKYMSAAYVLRTQGNRKQIKLADRIDQLCRLHPEFGKSAATVQSHIARELGVK